MTQVSGGARPSSVAGGTDCGGALPTATLVAAAEDAAGWDPGGWNAGTRHGVLADLDRTIATLETVRGGVLVAEEAADTWRGSGDPSLAAWRARTGRSGKRAAATQVRRAEGLAAAPQAAAAVIGGQIALEHASVIARLASTGSEVQRAVVTSDEGQRALLDMARRQDADTFATAAARFVAERDPQGLERDHDTQRAGRFLHLASTPSGTVVKGKLDNIAGQRLRLALEAVTPRPGADDDRDAGQRAADGLDTIARTILADTETRPGGHVPAQITMILSAQDWAAAKAERARRRAGGEPSPARVGPATLEDGTPVPGSELAQTMCDAAVTRLVIDAESRPLDVGRAERVFTGPRRRAVVVRDRHCVWPGCRMNARWCEVHHLDWWDRDGGHTDVHRGVLLCSFHHHQVHRRDLQLHEAGPAAPGDVAMFAYEVRDRVGRLVHPAGPAGQSGDGGGDGGNGDGSGRGGGRGGGSGGDGPDHRGGGGGGAPPESAQPSGHPASPEPTGTRKETGPQDGTGESGVCGPPGPTGRPGSTVMSDQGELDLLHGDSGDPGRVVDPELGEPGPRSMVA